jgi:hypothetical protein
MGVDSPGIKIKFPGVDGHLEFRKVILSLDPKEEFQAEKDDLPK